ncbi:Iodothyronine deiodinase [Urbifossiella limnaea]|uniref:Iodothyronine deiodinase n=1 Tax=Urbifossiella limnaea TaxID=2528023 RepID=A0A517XPA1_9BACT|nr:Iodothyronine deiodinase [Urbifossiella limnaea]
MRATLTLLLLAGVAGAADPPVVLPKLDPAKYADAKAAAATAAEIEKEYDDKRKPEAVKMLLAILKGSQMGPGEGWFGPARSRYTWKWLAAKHDLPPDAQALPRARFAGPPELFARLDRDGDGAVTPFDLDWSDRNPYVQQTGMVNRLFRRMDADGDSKLSREDFDAFLKRATGGKDAFTPDDFRAALLSAGPGGAFMPGDGPSIPMLVKGLYGSEVGSLQEGPAVGDAAPDFTLKTADGADTVTLSKLVGPKPVVLVFGNFTCGPFRAIFPEADALRERYKDKATFVMVYVREAHPLDGWKMESNTRVGVAVKQPTTTAERGRVCEQFQAKLKPGMKVLVDDIADTAGNLYSGMPARFYVIDTKGKVGFQSGRGPFGFKAGEMEQALCMALLEAAPPKDVRGALDHLPLPGWAAQLAGPMPKTTAKMLELDYLHRADNPLGNVLAARVRLACAAALGSKYGVATATGDLARMGVTAEPGADAPAVAFARKLSLEGHAITDAEFAAVLKQYGPERTTALVHTVAYCNFHNRIVCGLGTEPRADPPLPVAVDPALLAAPSSPARPPWDDVKAAAHAGPRISPAWSKGGADALGSALAAQKARTLRIPLPGKERFEGLTGREKMQAETILWNTVSSGYQPGMTRAWFACLGAFYEESKVDRVFTNTMFWVVTRTNDCFY